LKLPLLLAQFLYEHKTLNLPGIGIFTLDPSIIIPDEKDDKQNEFVPAVEFRNAPIHEADDELIEFIKKNTGKIRPLAISDLDSYLTLGQQMLNIGKPFYIDGVGTLVKSRDGKFEFVPGQHDVAGVQETDTHRDSQHAKKQTAFDDHTNYEARSGGGRRVGIAFAIILGLGIVTWGSYKLYQKNTTPEMISSPGPAITVTDSTAVKADTVKTTIPLVDSSQIKKTETVRLPVKAVKDSLQYKFVILSTSNKEKALKRYNQLLSFLLKIKMQTQDSSSFKLYFTFPAAAKDTVHIKDSLNMVYATHTIIEPPMKN
jgi:hypothetical protein